MVNYKFRKIKEKFTFNLIDLHAWLVLKFTYFSDFRVYGQKIHFIFFILFLDS